jgi:hypothetical protein
LNTRICEGLIFICYFFDQQRKPLRGDNQAPSLITVRVRGVQSPEQQVPKPCVSCRNNQCLLKVKIEGRRAARGNAREERAGGTVQVKIVQMVRAEH